MIVVVAGYVAVEYAGATPDPADCKTVNAVADGDKKRRVAELLERIGLADAGRALPHELSGGEVQRVAVARAMAHRPKMLLADEPTASLDSATGRNLINLMFAMGRESGCTMVLSTHDTEVMDLADQCIRIRDGMVQEGEGRIQKPVASSQNSS